MRQKRADLVRRARPVGPNPPDSTLPGDIYCSRVAHAAVELSVAKLDFLGKYAMRLHIRSVVTSRGHLRIDMRLKVRL